MDISYLTGASVSHKKWGEGIVTEAHEVESGYHYVVVGFGTNNVKQFHLCDSEHIITDYLAFAPEILERVTPDIEELQKDFKREKSVEKYHREYLLKRLESFHREIQNRRKYYSKSISVKAPDKRVLELVEIVDDFNIPDGWKKIPPRYYSYTPEFVSITIPGSVKVVGEAAFRGCKNVKRITFKSTKYGSTEIYRGAFEYCRNLEKIEFSENITRIAQNAFSYCYNLTEVVIPDRVKIIEHGAFKRCTRLRKINLPDIEVVEPEWHRNNRYTWPILPDCPSLVDVDVAPRLQEKLGQKHLRDLITGPMIAAYLSGEPQCDFTKKLVSERIKYKRYKSRWFDDCFEIDDIASYGVLLDYFGTNMTLDTLYYYVSRSNYISENRNVEETKRITFEHIKKYRKSILKASMKQPIRNSVNLINEYLAYKERLHSTESSLDEDIELREVMRDLSALLIQNTEYQKQYLEHCIETDNGDTYITGFLGEVETRLPIDLLDEMIEKSAGKPQVLSSLITYKDNNYTSDELTNHEISEMDSLWEELESLW